MTYRRTTLLTLAIISKVTTMVSDAIYNVTRGTVKPWKHTVMALGLASLTGPKVTIVILNRQRHCIDYSATKGLETEFTYWLEADDRDAPYTWTQD